MRRELIDQQREAQDAETKAKVPALERLPDDFQEGRYRIQFARTLAEIEPIQRLRYEVFNVELGEGLAESASTGLDHDEFDFVCHHLSIVDTKIDEIIGTYRLQTAETADLGRGFYTETEFDLSTMPAEIRSRSVELGRACIAKAHRKGNVLFALWRGLASYLAHNDKRYLFGCSSLTSQDPHLGVATAEYLQARGYAHPELVIEPLPEFDGRLAAQSVPAPAKPPKVKIPQLFQTYLRYGAKSCSAPAIDRRFGTIDYFFLLDVEQFDPRMFRLFFTF